MYDVMNDPLTFLIFCSAYNYNAVTLYSPDARTSPPLQGFPGIVYFIGSRYMGAGDPAQGDDLPLGKGLLAVQAVAQADDVGLPGRVSIISDMTCNPRRPTAIDVFCGAVYTFFATLNRAVFSKVH